MFITRVAGLPAEVMDQLTGACRRAAAACFQIKGEIEVSQAALMEGIYSRMGGLSRCGRRLALKIKRACFNGRSIASLVEEDGWPEIVSQLRKEVEEVLRHERRLTAAEEVFAAVYSKQYRSELESLDSIVRDPYLFRGIALASPDLAVEFERLRESGDQVPFGGRKRMETSFLRYVSRAALKVSPYSTLTRVGVGSVSDNGGPKILGTRWKEVSFFRLKRSLVDQLYLVLCRHREVRRRLSLALNSTVEFLGEDSYRFLRPIAIGSDPKTGTLRVLPASHVKMNLTGPVVDYIVESLRGLVVPYLQLQADLCAMGWRKEQVESALDRLIDVGLLETRPPWPSYDLRLEESLADFLLGFTGQDELIRIGKTMQAIVAAAESFPAVDSPHGTISEMKVLIRQAWEYVSGLVDQEVEVSLPPEALAFYEDVFLYSCDSGGDGGSIFSVEADVVADLLRCGNAIWKVFHLFSPRFNFTHSLAGLWLRKWPSKSRVPLLELFAEAQPLWREYVVERKKGKGEEFNPYLLPKIAELFEVRRGLAGQLNAVGQQASYIDVKVFEEIAGCVPDEYDPIVGCCLFAQPADRFGSLWVANRIFEGTGRYISRFTAAMVEPTRSRFIERLCERAIFNGDQGRIEILDMLYGHENTVNLHLPQTPKVLEIPGESSCLPPQRRLSLADLYADLDPVSMQVRIMDRHGVRYLPCHLSAVADFYLPVLLKFLSAFGPVGYIPSILPSWSSYRVNDILVMERLTFGRLVFRRKRWLVPRQMIPDPRQSDRCFFRQMSSFLTKASIDERVFWIEPVKASVDKERYKPQFLDFSSVLFVELLRSRLMVTSGDYITFEEVLPDREEYSCDSAGSRLAIEIVLDSLMERRV